MSNTKAEYFSDELADWNESIAFYSGETEELEKRLGEVVRRNSIVGIAEKVEYQQTLLNQVSDKLYRLQIQIQQQEESLKTDSALIDNTQMNNQTEEMQHKLRDNMHVAEKEFIDTKYNCYHFLSGILK